MMMMNRPEHMLMHSSTSRCNKILYIGLRYISITGFINQQPLRFNVTFAVSLFLGSRNFRGSATFGVKLLLWKLYSVELTVSILTCFFTICHRLVCTMFMYAICSSCPSPSKDWSEPKSLEYQGSQAFVGSGFMQIGQFFVCEIGKEVGLTLITDVLFCGQKDSLNCL